MLVRGLCRQWSRCQPSFMRNIASESPRAIDEEWRRKNDMVLDHTSLWKTGYFPTEPKKSAIFDTFSMLSTVSLHATDEFVSANRVIENIEYQADSVLKKRRKKMNKHKHRKRKKLLRMKTKKR